MPLPICLAVRGHPSPLASEIQLSMSLHQGQSTEGAEHGVVLCSVVHSCSGVACESCEDERVERWLWDVSSALKDSFQTSD